MAAGRHHLPLLPVWGIFPHIYGKVFLHVDEAFPVSLGLIVFFSFPLILLGKALGCWGHHHFCNLLFNLCLGFFNITMERRLTLQSYVD